MKKQYHIPQLECLEVTTSKFLCDSPGGMNDNGNGGSGGTITAPARTLYI